MEQLNRLNEVNDVPIYSVHSEEFLSFGRVLKGYDFTNLCEYMEKETKIPKEGNQYVASVSKMEAMEDAKAVKKFLYGGMPIQVGYCNGKNSTYNGFEYHKGSEINIAVTDFMLVLGHTYEISNLSYEIASATVFFVPKGTAIEMYQTTLHLSPLKVTEEGYKDIVILPFGTNTPLSEEEKAEAYHGDEETRLLLQRNKWVIAHPDREPLTRQGAYPGVIGENKELFY